MTILVVYSEEPAFPASAQQPDAVRYQIGDVWVDVLGEEPTPDEVEAFLVPAAYSIPKDLPWRRMTDAEAATTETLLAGTSARLRQIYNAATFLNTGDELFETLQIALVGAFGADRTAELLARDTTETDAWAGSFLRKLRSSPPSKTKRANGGGPSRGRSAGKSARKARET